MKKRIILLLGAALALYALFPIYCWNQKIQIVVETPNGIKTGHAVTRVQWNNPPKILPDVAGWSSSVKGEATIVDLGENKYIFALLGGVDRTAFKLFRNGREKISRADLISRIQSSEGTPEGIKPIPLDETPLLVTFEDINDPKTVKKLNPNNLAATFGEGYTLNAITLEITGESVTEGKIESALGWWNNLTVPIGGKTKRKYGDPLYGLGKWNFVRETQ